MDRAAIAVVGGGIIGANVAFHLAQRGVRDILVLDRGAGPGAGGTRAACVVGRVDDSRYYLKDSKTRRAV